MAIWKSLIGQYQVALISSDLSQMLTAINLEGIVLQQIRFVDELHLLATISRTQLPGLEQLITKRGEHIQITSKFGLFWKLNNITKRPVLVFGLLIIFLLCVFLPTRILFVEVTGSNKIPETYIVETAKKCGLSFFTSRQDVRSEKIKNALLSEIPQLQWAGVNTKGCVASITVRERDEKITDDTPQMANSIVAGRDGIVQEITVLSGTPLCKVGQGVKAGDVLVSGYTDCGLIIKLQKANAEVFAYTSRDLQSVTPLNALKRTSPQGLERKIMLRIGKNIINLWKDSGISDTRCVKMYSESYLTLPGGFLLPVALIVEYNKDYILAEDVSAPLDWLEASAERYLEESMVAGKILHKSSVISNEECLSILNGKYLCLEMIGQKRYEENIIQNGT